MSKKQIDPQALARLVKILGMLSNIFCIAIGAVTILMLFLPAFREIIFVISIIFLICMLAANLGKQLLERAQDKKSAAQILTELASFDKRTLYDEIYKNYLEYRRLTVTRDSLLWEKPFSKIAKETKAQRQSRAFAEIDFNLKIKSMFEKAGIGTFIDIEEASKYFDIHSRAALLLANTRFATKKEKQSAKVIHDFKVRLTEIVSFKVSSDTVDTLKRNCSNIIR